MRPEQTSVAGELVKRSVGIRFQTGFMQFQIRRATAADAEALTKLMHASSAYAGEYARILEGYAVTTEQIGRDVVFAADCDGCLIGFYSLVLEGSPELDLLFVADEAQGSGLGRELISHSKQVARKLGVDQVMIVSHPPSVGFYERMGATRVGTRPPKGAVSWERPILHLPT